MEEPCLHDDGPGLGSAVEASENGLVIPPWPSRNRLVANLLPQIPASPPPASRRLTSPLTSHRPASPRPSSPRDGGATASAIALAGVGTASSASVEEELGASRTGSIQDLGSPPQLPDLGRNSTSPKSVARAVEEELPELPEAPPPATPAEGPVISQVPLPPEDHGGRRSSTTPDSKRQQEKLLRRTVATAAQTLKHHISMCLKFLGMILECHQQRCQQVASGQTLPRYGTSPRSKPPSMPSARLPTVAPGAVSAAPLGLPWRPPEGSGFSALGSNGPGGQRFLLAAAQLDAMLNGILHSCESAQKRCLSGTPEAKACQSDEFISFDGTLTTVYEDEDAASKEERLEVPAEPNVLPKDFEFLRQEHRRLCSERSQLEQKRSEIITKLQRLEEQRQDLASQLRSKEEEATPEEAVATKEPTPPSSPTPLEDLGIMADKVDSGGVATMAVAELDKFAEKLMSIEREADAEREAGLAALRRVEEASGYDSGDSEEPAEYCAPEADLREVLGASGHTDLALAIEALADTRRQQLAQLAEVRQRCQQPLNTGSSAPSNAPAPARLSSGKPAACSTPSYPAVVSGSKGSPSAPGLLSLPLHSGSLDEGSSLEREVGSGRRGRRSSHHRSTPPPVNLKGFKDEAKYQALSARIAELKRQFDDLRSESNRTIAGTGQPGLRTSRSEAGLATAASPSQASPSNQGNSPRKDSLQQQSMRYRSPSCTSIQTGSSDWSLNKSGREWSVDHSPSADLSPSCVAMHSSSFASQDLDGAVAELLGPLSGAQQQPVQASNSRTGGSRPMLFNPRGDPLATSAPLTTAIGGPRPFQPLPTTGKGRAQGRSGRGSRDVPSLTFKVAAPSATASSSTSRPPQQLPPQSTAQPPARPQRRRAGASPDAAAAASRPGAMLRYASNGPRSPDPVGLSPTTAAAVAPQPPLPQSFAAAAASALGSGQLPQHLVAVPSSWEQWRGPCPRAFSPDGGESPASASPPVQPLAGPGLFRSVSLASQRLQQAAAPRGLVSRR